MANIKYFVLICLFLVGCSGSTQRVTVRVKPHEPQVDKIHIKSVMLIPTKRNFVYVKITDKGDNELFYRSDNNNLDALKFKLNCVNIIKHDNRRIVSVEYE